MKLLADSPSELDLRGLIDAEAHGDYIYMYPPRQAYFPMNRDGQEKSIINSLSGTSGSPVNLYYHFPFCRQICSFCNLYSVTANPKDQFDEYISLLIRETNWWAQFIKGRSIDTIYLGGGTPSIFGASALDRLVRHIEATFDISRDAVAELALEVAPDTVDEVKLKELAGIGINRVNLGLQTSSDEGLRQIGRHHGFSLARKRIEEALSCDFLNVCVDIIYGLPDQTITEWEKVVLDVMHLQPPTVCAYPLTLRPNTGFSKRSIVVYGPHQYKKYEMARDLLTMAGYDQETHVRYSIPNVGGYRQKANHWSCQDVIGIGAGARGYLAECDYRNGYSIRNRRDALRSYIEKISSGMPAFGEGYALDTDEQMRRRVILGLFDLNLGFFESDYGISATDYFQKQFQSMTELDLISINNQHARLTPKGRMYRDLISQAFFSPKVWEQVSAFDYNE